MKRKFFIAYLFVSICFSVALNANPGNSLFGTGEEITQEIIDLITPEAAEAPTEIKAISEEDLECWIVDVSVSCGGTYETQYCDEGLHGSLTDWVMQVDGWACD
jgi:hypothetical protein